MMRASQPATECFLVGLVFSQKVQELEVRFEPKVLHQAVNLAIAVFRVAVLDALGIFYQEQFAITCITKKTWCVGKLHLLSIVL